MAIIWIHNRKTSKTNEAEIKRLPKLSKEQFLKLLKAKGTRVITDDTVKSSFKQHEQNKRQNIAKLKELYKNDKVALSKLMTTKDVENPFETIDRNGREVKVGMINKDAMIYDLISNHYITQSNINKYRIYRILYEGILESVELNLSTLKNFKKLTVPGKVKFLDKDDLNNELKKIAEFCKKQVFINKFKFKPWKCSDEIGTGLETDSCDNINCTPSDIGLLKNVNWPLRDYNTCVRNQGGRGTCVSFGTIAAVESAIAVKYNLLVNLSEQDLYRHFKLDWHPTPNDYYGDGHSAITALTQAISNRYVFPYEKDWDYNPSFRRNGDDDERDYDDSCISSGSCDTIGNCSDTNHQAQLKCYQIGENLIKQYVRSVHRWDEAPADAFNKNDSSSDVDSETAGRWVSEEVKEVITEMKFLKICVYDDSELRSVSRYFIPHSVSVFDVLDFSFMREIGLLFAIFFLNLKIPIVFSFKSVPSYKHGNLNNGYATYIEDEEYKSGHCVLITGFISNSNLPTGAPRGSGGGYFIIKNSWGNDYGDCGYAYLPYNWVKKWGAQMIAVPYVGKTVHHLT